MNNSRELTGNPVEYVFVVSYNSHYFENAPTIKEGSVLKECFDGWYQLFEPDGITKIEARFHGDFILIDKPDLFKLNETKKIN